LKEIGADLNEKKEREKKMNGARQGGLYQRYSDIKKCGWNGVCSGT
jgi:hypothetical protein